MDSGDWDEALAAADEALAWWRGPLLADLADEPWVADEAARADHLRADCLDARITALLGLGRVPQALASAAELRSATTLADRGCWLHMLALYRAGRVTDALDVYTRHARLLDDELGVQPGREVRELQTAILRQAPELAAWPRSPEWTGAGAVATPAAPTVEPSVVPAGPSHGALIGRSRELSIAAGVLSDVAAGAARWLVLSGPAGIGKTRLAEEVAARVVADGGDMV